MISLCNFSKMVRYTDIKQTIMKFTNIESVKGMIGKRVKAVGVCGITDGVTVTGVLESIQNGDVIVRIPQGSKGNTIPCLANKNTLELINGSCDNCDSAVSDAEAFNQICFNCGKKV